MKRYAILDQTVTTKRHHAAIQFCATLFADGGAAPCFSPPAGLAFEEVQTAQVIIHALERLNVSYRYDGKGSAIIGYLPQGDQYPTVALRAEMDALPGRETLATHLHIDMQSGGEAIRLMCKLNGYLPLLIAISASSPLWRGYDTGHASYRHRILAITRSYGIPSSFTCWNAFVHFFNLGVWVGLFQTIKDIHWDIRPYPGFGLQELRDVDAQPLIAAVVDLAGFVRALVLFLKRLDGTKLTPDLPQPLPWWIEKHNHLQAAHLGLDAKYIQDEASRGVTTRKVPGATMAASRRAADGLEQASYLDRSQKRVESGVSCQRQKGVYVHFRSMKQVVSSLIRELEEETDLRIPEESES